MSPLMLHSSLRAVVWTHLSSSVTKLVDAGQVDRDNVGAAVKALVGLRVEVNVACVGHIEQTGWPTHGEAHVMQTRAVTCDV
jgi:hypothetical protein